MSRTLRAQAPPSQMAETARLRAEEVAHQAGIEILGLSTIDDHAAASRLFDDLWGTGPGDSYLSPSLMRALEHAGNYSAGAWSGSTLVGAVMGFLGQDAGGTYLHSHILGVSAAARGSNVGYALKQHQRAWALALGLPKITWTFDPLVRRNAYFNIQKLGAEGAAYLENFYGRMDDDINGADESDRLLVEWVPTAPRPVQAADGRLPDPAIDLDGATVALSAAGEVTQEAWGDRVLCATPDDVVALRRSDPAAALAWRRGLRRTLGVALAHGYSVVGFARTGWYVLERS